MALRTQGRGTLSVPLDGSQASKLAIPQWQASVQRQLGLHLSAPKP